jgi:hypothetical protein
MAQQKTAEIYDLKGKTTGKITLPNVFSTPLRPDVIKRAVLAIQSSRIQPQGSSLFAFYINWLFAFFFKFYSIIVNLFLNICLAFLTYSGPSRFLHC